MSIEVFIDELRARFLPLGSLNVATTTNIPGQPMPRYDAIWFVEAISSGIEVHIRDLRAYQPTVVIDVPSHFSLEYSLGSATSDVMLKANEGYACLEEELKGINRYADLILDAYNVSISYDKASMLFSQFYGTNKPERLQEAYKALKDLTLYSTKCIQLRNAIEITSKAKGITL